MAPLTSNGAGPVAPLWVTSALPAARARGRNRRPASCSLVAPRGARVSTTGTVRPARPASGPSASSTKGVRAGSEGAMAWPRSARAWRPKPREPVLGRLLPPVARTTLRAAQHEPSASCAFQRSPGGGLERRLEADHTGGAISGIPARATSSSRTCNTSCARSLLGKTLPRGSAYVLQPRSSKYARAASAEKPQRNPRNRCGASVS